MPSLVPELKWMKQLHERVIPAAGKVRYIELAPVRYAALA
jgi:hypothetical protein